MALFYSSQMAVLLANIGGAVPQLPAATVAGGRERVFCANVAYAAQAAGSQIAIARIPLGSVITGITVITDTSTGTATLAIGDQNTANYFATAATYTTTNTPVRVGLAATHASPITVGYDFISGNAVTYQKPGEGGAVYEDVMITTATAALPASGNLVVIIEYAID